MTTIEALTSETGDSEETLYYAVRREDVGNCRDLNWAWTSIRPYVLASGPTNDGVYAEAIGRVGHDDVVVFVHGLETMEER